MPRDLQHKDVYVDTSSEPPYLPDRVKWPADGDLSHKFLLVLESVLAAGLNLGTDDLLVRDVQDSINDSWYPVKVEVASRNSQECQVLVPCLASRDSGPKDR